MVVHSSVVLNAFKSGGVELNPNLGALLPHFSECLRSLEIM
jgi:hypothetical protein